MGYLERFARKRENRSETITARLDPDTHKRFKEHCDRLGLTLSEAVALLVEAEVRGEVREPGAIRTTKTTQTEVTNTLDDDKNIQRYTPTPRPKVQQPRRSGGAGGRFTTKPYVVNGRLPCPICETWPERQANISRHMREIHDRTAEEVYKAHMDKVREMVAKARGES